MAPQSDPFMH